MTFLRAKKSHDCSHEIEHFASLLIHTDSFIIDVTQLIINKVLSYLLKEDMRHLNFFFLQC